MVLLRDGAITLKLRGTQTLRLPRSVQTGRQWDFGRRVCVCAWVAVGA